MRGGICGRQRPQRARRGGGEGRTRGEGGRQTFQPPRSGVRSGLCGHFSRMDDHADYLGGIRLAVLWLAVRILNPLGRAPCPASTAMCRLSSGSVPKRFYMGSCNVFPVCRTRKRPLKSLSLQPVPDGGGRGSHRRRRPAAVPEVGPRLSRTRRIAGVGASILGPGPAIAGGMVSTRYESSPIRRPSTAIHVQRAMDTSPTTLPQTGPTLASSAMVTLCRSVKVKINVTRRSRIFSQKNGL